MIKTIHKKNAVSRRKAVKKSKKKTISLAKKLMRAGLSFLKHKENPIIKPTQKNSWESWQTFNPGAILLEKKVHFLYRAIGMDGISRLGYAVSNNGFAVGGRLPSFAYEHRLIANSFNFFSYASGGSFGGSEDPRIVQVNKENTLYMTYTACDDGLRVALTSIKLQDFLKKKWKWSQPKLISPPGEVHKNWVIFSEKIKGKYAILTSINPKISIAYRGSLDFKNNEHIASFYDGHSNRHAWSSYIRGAGPPPVKTKLGWLLLYHALDKREPEKYKVGAMLLDLADPTKILYRAQKPVLEPNEYYESNGFKAGVVYALGAVVKNGKLLIYYGGADSYTCVASANLVEFLNALIKTGAPKLSRIKKRYAKS